MAYLRNSDVFFTITDGELIILDDEEEQFFTSNAVASLIWLALETPKSSDALVAAIVEHFDGVDAATARVDLDELLTALKARGLVSEVATA